MKALILLATLKKDKLSNTETLTEFFIKYLENEKIECSVIKLVNYNILPGTYNNMGEDDEWPSILEKIKSSDIIIFATPIWWNNQSSEMQKVIERLDEIHDDILDGKQSIFEGKVGGIIITGDSDGAQHVIANISNFFNAIGLILPSFSTLSVLWEGHKKNVELEKKELLDYYNKNYHKTTERMVENLVSYVEGK